MKLLRAIVTFITWHTWEKYRLEDQANAQRVASQLQFQKAMLLPFTEGDLGDLIQEALEEYAALTKPLTLWDRFCRAQVSVRFYSRDAGWSHDIFHRFIMRRYTSLMAAIELTQVVDSMSRIHVHVSCGHKNLLMNILLMRITPGKYLGRQLTEITVGSFRTNRRGHSDLVLHFEIPDGMLVPAQR